MVVLWVTPFHVQTLLILVGKGSFSSLIFCLIIERAERISLHMHLVEYELRRRCILRLELELNVIFYSPDASLDLRTTNRLGSIVILILISCMSLGHTIPILDALFELFVW